MRRETPARGTLPHDAAPEVSLSCRHPTCTTGILARRSPRLARAEGGVPLGVEIQQDRFSEHDFVEFRRRLLEGLEALDMVLARPGFGRGERTIGAELELFLIDDAGRPLPISTDVVRATD